MKQRYEERIAELEEERNAAEQEQERVELELNRALDVGRRLQAGVPAASQDVQTEVPSLISDARITNLTDTDGCPRTSLFFWFSANQ